MQQRLDQNSWHRRTGPATAMSTRVEVGKTVAGFMDGAVCRVFVVMKLVVPAFEWRAGKGLAGLGVNRRRCDRSRCLYLNEHAWQSQLLDRNQRAGREARFGITGVAQAPVSHDALLPLLKTLWSMVHDQDGRV